MMMLREVAAEATAAQADAEAAARAELEHARAAADELVERARAEAATAAELEAGRARAQAEQRARRLVLAARKGVYDDFRRDALSAAMALRDSSDYPLLLERLARVARSQLGEGAELEVDPPHLGGVRARAGRRHVDYTLPVLVARCVEAHGEELERLWR
jgi:vacuolar-type H+-ATPase subunit E/Vma4